jgi:hypothetical protein
MTLPVQLDQATERRLRERARSMQTDPEALAADILKRAMLNLDDAPDPSNPDRGVGMVRETREERQVRVAAARREINELNDQVRMPVLPPDAFTTESYYQDHD